MEVLGHQIKTINRHEDKAIKILEAIFKKEKLNFCRYRNVEICIFKTEDGKFKYSIFDLKSLKEFPQIDASAAYDTEQEAFSAGRKDVDLNFCKTAILIDGPVVVYFDGKSFGHNFGTAKFKLIHEAYEDALWELELSKNYEEMQNG